METNNDNNASQSQQLQDEDVLSTLTDDILLSILGRVSLRVAARTCVLSTRWRHLPWLLPELSIDVKDFLSVPCPDPIKANDMEKAMVSLTNAARSFLADQQRESSISSLHLKLYLVNTFLCEVGSLIDFHKLDMHHVVFDCCKQLKHLTLLNCQTGENSLFKIDAPNSNLCVLDIHKCRFEIIEVVFLPKLEKFSWDTWVGEYAPVAFGYVPSLGELELSCGAECDQGKFKLSELLHGVTGMHTLTLDFQGENKYCCIRSMVHFLCLQTIHFILSCDQIWLQPEIEELFIAFNKLKKLSIRGIFVEFDILWTMAFLVAAPSIEILHIEVWEHACEISDARLDSPLDRRTPQWEMRFEGSENRLLKELEFAGFRSLEQQFTFIGSVLERSPNLHKIVLRGDEQCKSCDALEESPRPSKYPKKKDEQEMVVKRIRYGTFSPEIFFEE